MNAGDERLALAEADRVVGRAPEPAIRLAPARAYPVLRENLRGIVSRAVNARWRFASLVADEPRPDRQGLVYLFVAPGVRVPIALCVDPADQETPSIAPAYPGASWAEREVRDLFDIRFSGMPDPRPLVHHEDWPGEFAPLRLRAPKMGLPLERKTGRYAFRQVEGEGVMEIRVGPIHAGIIEPGHFRFSAVGETVLGLEIRLFYVHRGVEHIAVGMAPRAAIALGERVSGTSSVAHALALARAIEIALDVEVPPAHALARSLLLELERLYNHAGDLGNLCAGTALSGLLAEGFIIKERLLVSNQRLTGSRYLRNLVGLGGVRRLPPREDLEAALRAAEEAMAAVERFADKFFGSASNMERLTGTGVLSPEHARNLGVVGVAARASGLATDSRSELEFTSAADRAVFSGFEVATDCVGDVAARARVRLQEARSSLALARTLVAAIRDAQPLPPGVPQKTGGAGLGWSESPRGEILTYVRLAGGKVARLRVRSPSRMNWPAIEHAMPGNIVPDFPLINKSFNLSYAGCDL